MEAPELQPEKMAERRADLFKERRRLKDQALSARLAVFLVGPLATLLTALVLIFFVFFEHSIVSGPSMLPTLRGGDYVLATKGLPDPMHGDIVILNVVYKGVREEWVKRVVALPGDRVDVRGDIILVNGTTESFGHLTITGDATIPVQSITVPPGQIFVAGDNRPVSEDSRYVGTFPLTSIRGRVVFIYAPAGRFGPVAGPPR